MNKESNTYLNDDDSVAKPKPEAFLHNYFVKSVNCAPDKTAIVCGDERITFKQLERRSNQLANYLVSLGCRPGTMVAIYLKRTMNPYVAMLATLKAGGAYVPLDPLFPKERIDYILTDADAKIVITESELIVRQQIRAPSIVVLDKDREKINRQSDRVSESQYLEVNHPAYAIYTSGSTGKPKGVLIEHKAASHFIASMLSLYGVGANDKIYQGFSHCFDASVEEIWLAFSTSATMFVGTDDIHKSSEAVADFINKNQISFFSTVPTFLSAIPSDLPSIKTLILGGEKLPQELVDIWAIPGRRMLNTYGPTEATVVATADLCEKGKSVTIGKPLEHYLTYILDSEFKQVPRGCEGELCISGPVLARGYIGRPDLTEKSFINNPFQADGSDQRLYRTGDLVRLNKDGDIEFIGRIDSQVKIRGYRVELSEIEAVLNSFDEIQFAAVKVIEIEGIQNIASFVKLQINIETLNTGKLREFLRSKLPKYMVPTFLDILQDIPVLPSGKTNYKELPVPQKKLSDENRVIVPPRNELEKSLFLLCAEVFNTENISVYDDFFDDLAGHSLLAATYAGHIRHDLGYECMSIRDVIEFPTIALLSEQLCQRVAIEKTTVSADTLTKAEANFQSLNPLTKIAVPALQATTIYCIYAIFASLFSYVFGTTIGYIEGEKALSELVTLIVCLLLFTFPALILTSVVLKWTLIGKYKAGEYKLWGWFYLRWWIVTRFQQLSGSQLLCGSPLMNLFYRMMGAKLGDNVCLDTSATVAFDLVNIGSNTSVCADTHILGYRVEDGLLKIAPVSIGKSCFIGIHCALGLNSKLENNCRLEDYTAIDDNELVADGSQLSGSPAVEAQVQVPTQEHFIFSKAQKVASLCMSVLSIYAFFSVISIFSLTVAVLGILTFVNYGMSGTATMIFLGGPFILLASSMVVVVVKLLVSPKSNPGTYRLYSPLYYRKWFVDLFIKTHRMLFIPLYATLYLPHFLRLLGAKLGKRCELSTVAQISPDLIEAGEECFYADAAIIGGKRIFGGYFQIDKCKVGNRTFIGNSAMLPIGTDIGDECLVGCLSTPPKNLSANDVPHDEKWLGCPPLRLGNTQTFDGFTEEELYRPNKLTYAKRYLVDSIRVLLPTYAASFSIILACFALWLLPQFTDGLLFYALLPLAMFSITCISMLVSIMLKQIIMGTFKPVVKPLWSPYVWFNEVVNALYESVYTPSILLFCGTPFMSPLLRGFGVRMGKRVYIDSTYFSEFDLAEIGDFAAVNLGTTIQTHLFEDRIMKSSYLKIGKGASIGNMSVVLYDTDIKQGVNVKPFSLVMKGETLPAHTSWAGIPVQRYKK